MVQSWRCPLSLYLFQRHQYSFHTKTNQSTIKPMKILHKLQISPPQKSVPDSSTLLTFLDVIWIDSHPVRICFFSSYPHSTSQFIDSHLTDIKSSLSFTLRHFYPLAGKLRLSPDSNEQYEILYKDGDSISLTIVESEENFLALSKTEPHDSLKILPLAPEVSKEDLVAIQLTIFPNKGICIGFSIHHAACDGFSYTHFIKSWASICKSGLPLPLDKLPSFDRAALDSLHEYYLRYLKIRQEFGNTSHNSKTETESETLSLSTILRISLEEVEKLKTSVQAKAKLLQKSLPYCSAYIVSCAYTWSCMVKLRKYSDDQKVCFPLPVDWRKRLEPQAAPMYFGSCVLHSVVQMKAGDLAKDDGVMLACEAIGHTIKELGNGIGDVIKKGMDDQFDILVGNPIFSVAGSNRFGVYGVDFGWGQPVKVEMVGNNEFFYMSENGDEPRSVEIGAVLPKHEMGEFIAIFTQGLTLL